LVEIRLRGGRKPSGGKAGMEEFRQDDDDVACFARYFFLHGLIASPARTASFLWVQHRTKPNSRAIPLAGGIRCLASRALSACDLARRPHPCPIGQLNVCPMTTKESSEELRQRIRDLSEENAQLAEMIVARDNFLAIAAHELRNPMTPIISRLALLRRALAAGTLLPEKLDLGLGQLETAITHFLKRATILLDVSRITTGKLKIDPIDIDVCEVIHAVAGNFAPQAQSAGSPIVLDVPAGGVVVLGDWLAIVEIVENLLSNAIKYGAGKPVVVSVAADVPNVVARISVRDGGPGISPDSQARIFERFERAVPAAGRTGGFGVGLWIVNQLTAAMKGTVQVTSTPAGSNFCITLPMKPEASR
jgi:two-component system, OmpR family, sensor kinase